MNDNTINFYNVQQDFNQYWEIDLTKGYGWKQFRRWEHFWEQRVQPSGQRPVPKHTWQTYYDYQRAFPNDTEKKVSVFKLAATWTYRLGILFVQSWRRASQCSC